MICCRMRATSSRRYPLDRAVVALSNNSRSLLTDPCSALQISLSTAWILLTLSCSSSAALRQLLILLSFPLMTSSSWCIFSCCSRSRAVCYWLCEQYCRVTTLELFPKSLLPFNRRSSSLRRALFYQSTQLQAWEFCCRRTETLPVFPWEDDARAALEGGRRLLFLLWMGLGLSLDCECDWDFWREDWRRVPCRLLAMRRVPESICWQQAGSRSKTVLCLQQGSMVCRQTLDCYII